MTRLADGRGREKALAQRPRVDAERERVKILERPLEEVRSGQAQRAELIGTWIACARRFAR
ncbi:MAG TPA: hypothetical protein VKA58_04890 [Propionibacteriaceae bacterium]|jgi:hypothetical protein|nr:hypothetical protein [Propionibacteriaceae bacterium]